MKKVTKGNVFEDLGFDPAESADLALRAYLMAEIRRFIESNDLTQVKAAKFFGIKQPKVSNIINGKVEEISSDYLVGLLAKTGGELRYSFKQPTKRQAEQRLRACAAETEFDLAECDHIEREVGRPVHSRVAVETARFTFERTKTKDQNRRGNRAVRRRSKRSRAARTRNQNRSVPAWSARFRSQTAFLPRSAGERPVTRAACGHER